MNLQKRSTVRIVGVGAATLNDPRVLSKTNLNAVADGRTVQRRPARYTRHNGRVIIPTRWRLRRVDVPHACRRAAVVRRVQVGAVLVDDELIVGLTAAQTVRAPRHET